AEAEAEAATPPETAPQPAPTETRRGGFAPALIGGIVAAVLGFLAGRADLIDPLLPPGLRASDGAEAIAALQSKLDQQQAALSALKSDIGKIEMPDISGLSAQLGDLSAQLAPLATTAEDLSARTDSQAQALSALTARLSELEARPVAEGASPEVVAAYEAELSRTREVLAAQRAEVEQMVADAQTLKATAAADAQRAANRGTLAQLRGQLEAGAAYAEPLAALTAAGIDIPVALSGPAADGVASLAVLRDTFPPAARAALADLRQETRGTGLLAFLERQTGARSVTPRAGDDPDAVLSRAEAAVTSGDLATALDLVAALPEAAQAALADWVAQASSRHQAIAAADALAQSLNSN
ncbi:MAG TPA: hypothetical protein DET67_15170, partial [Ruegeria sp.]|nr:hypothetical protein [Ruegeria sp.]